MTGLAKNKVRLLQDKPIEGDQLNLMDVQI